MRATLLALAVFLSGCGSLQLAAPRSFDDRLAYTHGSVTATMISCTQLLERQRLTHEQGRKCQTLTDQATAALAMARGSTDPQTGQHWLTLATNLLTQLETMLNEAK